MQWSFFSKTEVLLLFVGLRCRFGLRLGTSRFSRTFGIRFSFLISIITATRTNRCAARGVLLFVELFCVPTYTVWGMGWMNNINETKVKANPAQSWSSFPLRLPLHTWASQGLLELGNIPIGRCLTAILHVSISDPFEDWTHMWLFSFFLLRTCETSVVSVWLKICEYKAGYIYIYLGIGELLWSVLCISSNCFEVFCAFHRKVNWAAPL